MRRLRLCFVFRKLLPTELSSTAAMKAALSILAIAALAATSYAEFLAYSKQDFESLGLTDPKKKSSEASVINVENGMEVSLANEKVKNGAKFDDTSEPIKLPILSDIDPHPICGIYNGVYIKNTDSTFCRVQAMEVTLHENQCGKQYIEYVLFFDTDETGPVAVRVPILKEPDNIIQIDPSEEENLSTWEKVMLREKKYTKWASDHEVGITPPHNKQQFEVVIISKESSFPMRYNWLQDLFTFGITESSNKKTWNENKVTTYTTSAIVLPQEFLESCASMIAYLKA